MRQAASPPVIAVVGASGSGKTTLLEALVPALRARGLRVGVIKHASHGFEADRPGKDSHRLYRAGADAVALASRRQVALFLPRAHDGDPPLSDALAALPAGLDLVLAEGFSWERVPRVVVRRKGAARRLDVERGEVLARVETPTPPPDGPPPFDPARIRALAARIAERAGAPAPSRAGAVHDRGHNRERRGRGTMRPVTEERA